MNNTIEDEEDEVQEVRPIHPIVRDQTKKKGKAWTPSASSTAGFDVESGQVDGQRPMQYMKRKVGNEYRDVEDNEDNDTNENNSYQIEQNSEYSVSLETQPIKKRGRPKKSVRANENENAEAVKLSASVKKGVGVQGKSQIMEKLKDTEDNANDEDNEDSHSAQEEQNTKDYESLETLLIKRCGCSKKSVRTNENKSSSVKKRGRPRKSNDEAKKKTISSKRKIKRSRKTRTRTTPTSLFNAMPILNVDRQKCLHEMGFGSMIGMAIHELSGKIGFYVIDNLDTETNVLSLNDSSILVTSQSVHDILRIPIGGCSIESLAPRSPDDPFIKEWFSQFGEKTEIRPNDITNLLYLHSTKCDEFDVIRKTPTIRNWKSVQMKYREKLEIEKYGGFVVLPKHEAINLQSEDFIEMILAKCKNINQDLRFLSEELYEGVSRLPN
ncbi:ulp1 protease family, C-terminal catalytic domain-containing protein [Tanacetum coccineum]